jgi:hypothetical protein
MILADTVLALHVGVILFNVFGVVVIPLGGWLGWRFVRVGRRINAILFACVWPGRAKITPTVDLATPA